MKTLKYSDFTPHLTLLGRDLVGENGVLWFNWSASGFRLRFTGRFLKARFAARQESMIAPYETVPLLLDPVIGVRLEGASDIVLRQKLTDTDQWVMLYDGEEGEHLLEVRKLSENVMGKCGLIEVETDGDFLPAPPKKAMLLEMVGDSITCGYGNETDQPGIRTEDENGLAAFGFLAAEELGMEYSAISVSGCGVTDPVWLPGLKNRGMLSMYAYVDAPMERSLGELKTKWNFAENPAKVIVINLGTNDANDIKMRNFAPEATAEFHENYRSLLKLIRAMNGLDAKILCTLGSMDYYLWDEVRDIVAAYQTETGDNEVYCSKLGPINHFTEGIGADTHPSAKTHLRMGKELAAAIRKIL